MKHELLNSILERIEPYDKNVCSKAMFMQELNLHAHLKETLAEKLEEDQIWLECSKNKVFFILNDDRWKNHRIKHHTSNIRLSLIGEERIPTISLDLS